MSWSLSQKWLVSWEGGNRVVEGLQNVDHGDLESLAMWGKREWYCQLSS